MCFPENAILNRYISFYWYAYWNFRRHKRYFVVCSTAFWQSHWCLAFIIFHKNLLIVLEIHFSPPRPCLSFYSTNHTRSSLTDANYFHLRKQTDVFNHTLRIAKAGDFCFTLLYSSPSTHQPTHTPFVVAFTVECDFSCVFNEGIWTCCMVSFYWRASSKTLIKLQCWCIKTGVYWWRWYLFRFSAHDHIWNYFLIVLAFIHLNA